MSFGGSFHDFKLLGRSVSLHIKVLTQQLQTGFLGTSLTPLPKPRLVSLCAFFKELKLSVIKKVYYLLNEFSSGNQGGRLPATFCSLAGLVDSQSKPKFWFLINVLCT